MQQLTVIHMHAVNSAGHMHSSHLIGVSMFVYSDLCLLPPLFRWLCQSLAMVYESNYQVKCAVAVMCIKECHMLFNLPPSLGLVLDGELPCLQLCFL